LASPAGVVQCQDVWVVQLGRDLDLSQKPVGPDDRRELGSQDLDGHLPAVLQVVGEVDRRHPAAAELPLDGVAPGEGGVEALELIGLQGRLQTPKVAPQLRVATPAHLPLPFTPPHRSDPMKRGTRKSERGTDGRAPSTPVPPSAFRVPRSPPPPRPPAHPKRSPTPNRRGR